MRKKGPPPQNEESPFTFKYVAKTKKKGDIIKETERALGFQLTEIALSPEQQAAFDAICHWYEYDTDSQQVLTLGGFAGTGKSTLVSILAGKYSDASIAFCSYTGKATSVLRAKLYDANIPGHHDVKTVHSLMYIPIPDEVTGRVLAWKRRSSLDYDLIIVDEASMLGEEMFNDLKSYGIPILAVGDHGQLPPVFGSFNLMERPQLRLEKIHRQAQDSPILAMADCVRRIGYIPRFNNSVELQILQRQHVDQVLDSLFSTPDVHYGDVALLCYSNRHRVALNEQARRARWRGAFKQAPIVGDQLICLRNVSGTIFNGMRGELKRCDDTTVLHYDARVLFEDDEIEVEGPVCKEQFGRDKTIRDFEDFYQVTGYNAKHWNAVGLLFDYGHALTIHKAQGSQMEHVIVAEYDLPNRIDFDTRKRALYTAITRCSKYLVILQ